MRYTVARLCALLLCASAMLAEAVPAQTSSRLMLSSSISSSGGELAQRGGAGGAAGLSWRIGEPDRWFVLRPEVALHVFRREPTAQAKGITSTVPYFPALAILAYTKPLARGIYGLVGPAALGSYGPSVWGLGGIAGIGVRPSAGRVGLEGRFSAARVPNPDVGPKRFFDVQFFSVGLTFSR